MPLETGVNDLDDLNPSWPIGTDPKSEGDDHIRNVKLAAINSNTARVDEITALDARVTANEDAIAVLQLAVNLMPQYWQWGYVNSNGTVGGGNGGWSVTRRGVGDYRLELNNGGLSGKDNALVALPAASLAPVTAAYTIIDHNTVDVVTGRSDTGAATDLDFMFIRFAE